jgi:hypothetical protein
MPVKICGFSQLFVVKTIFSTIIILSSVYVATGYVMHDLGVGLQVRYGQELYIFHVVQTGFRIHPGSYTMSAGVSFPGD